jgi:hypothetical protein
VSPLISKLATGLPEAASNTIIRAGWRQRYVGENPLSFLLDDEALRLAGQFDFSRSFSVRNAENRNRGLPRIVLDLIEAAFEVDFGDLTKRLAVISVHAARQPSPTPASPPTSFF